MVGKEYRCFIDAAFLQMGSFWGWQAYTVFGNARFLLRLPGAVKRDDGYDVYERCITIDEF